MALSDRLGRRDHHARHKRPPGTYPFTMSFGPRAIGSAQHRAPSDPERKGAQTGGGFPPSAFNSIAVHGPHTLILDSFKLTANNPSGDARVFANETGLDVLGLGLLLQHVGPSLAFHQGGDGRWRFFGRRHAWRRSPSGTSDALGPPVPGPERGVRIQPGHVLRVTVDAGSPTATLFLGGYVRP